MSTAIACRRRHRRFVLPGDGSACIRFGYPRPSGSKFALALRDVSSCGVSFVLDREFPGLEVGLTIENVRVTVGAVQLAGDVLVMRLTPDAGAGSVCGALFFPDGDDNILGLQRLVADLEVTEEADVAVD